MISRVDIAYFTRVIFFHGQASRYQGIQGVPAPDGRLSGLQHGLGPVGGWAVGGPSVHPERRVMKHDGDTFTVFGGHEIIASGSLAEVAMAVRSALAAGDRRLMLVFDDRTGRTIDLDLRGTDEEITGRLTPAPRARGRPKLGVVAREITLLPRHWEWLERQQGGASVALRRLVDAARSAGGEAEAIRAAREAAYWFMSAIAGDLPGYEEALRALYAGDLARFMDRAVSWPADIREHAVRLGFPAGS